MKFKQSKEFKSNLNLDKVLLNLKHQLNSDDFSTEIKSNEIEFQKILRTSTHTGKNVSDAFNLLKSGKFILKDTENNSFLISYYVNVNHLIFFSIIIGVLIGLATGISGIQSTFFSILTSMLIAFLIILIGLFSMKLKMSEIIKFSVF